MMLKLIRKRKRNWLGHWLRRNCLIKDALEGMVNGRQRSARARWSWNNLESVKVRSCEAVTCHNRSKFCPDRRYVRFKFVDYGEVRYSPMFALQKEAYVFVSPCYKRNVEIYHMGKWGSVCDDEWDMREASVVCRQLGYERPYRVTHSSMFGPARRRFWMDNLYCSGDEKDLSHCRFDGWGANDCTSSEAAGVICLSSETTTTEEPTTTATPPKKNPLVRIKNCAAYESELSKPTVVLFSNQEINRERNVFTIASSIGAK
ncbi:hypothetical protein ANN_02443 [Periplaneta americana]|uniref:SRCR domain-containing protein n=1 Tax=Periplaneta americana TaxID=6978 RepID=A0ABQ8TZ90_PERAM|nr:hypothetical protein ANN_02443 [Periplaneta americana]